LVHSLFGLVHRSLGTSRFSLCFVFRDLAFAPGLVLLCAALAFLRAVAGDFTDDWT
jgi:hypothetical protein